MKEVSLKLKNGEKEAEFNIKNSDDKEIYTLISSIFDFLEVDISLSNITKNFLETQKLYEDFYSQLPTTDFTTTNENITYQKSESVVTKNESINSFDGTKVVNGKLLYRSKYKCTNCGHRGIRYIESAKQTIRCHECNKMHRAYPALKNVDILGEPKATPDFTYYVAGVEERR